MSKATLAKLKSLDYFNSWMYDTIKPYLKGNIIEVGCGLGTFSERVVYDFPQSIIYLIDINSEYIQMVRKRFQNKPNVTVGAINLENFQEIIHLNTQFDSCFSLNVLEHIENDVQVLENVYHILRKNGRFVFLVPAHRQLYNSLDIALDHYRRYTKNEIKAKVAQTKFKLVNIFYFNTLAIFGWYLTGEVFKRTSINGIGVRLFDKLIYLKRRLGLSLRGKIGISLIAILQK